MTTTTIPQRRDLEAIKFLKRLRVGDEILVRVNGKDERMMVSRPIDLNTSHSFTTQIPMWDMANIHAVVGLGKAPISISVTQQMEKSDEGPWVVDVIGRNMVRAVEVGSDLYKRIDEIVRSYTKNDAISQAIKNSLSKRAKMMEST